MCSAQSPGKLPGQPSVRKFRLPLLKARLYKVLSIPWEGLSDFTSLQGQWELRVLSTSQNQALSVRPLVESVVFVPWG